MMKSLCHYTAILAMALTFLAPTAVYADGAAAPSMLDVTPKPDVKAFYDAHLAVIVDGLTKSIHPVPRVTARVVQLYSLIRERYGVSVSIKLTTELDKHAPATQGQSAIVNGEPIVFVIVPAFMVMYNELQQIDASTSEATLQNALVLTVFHELEHLAYGLAPFGELSSEALDQAELFTWAHTCEDSIRIFVELGLPIDKSHLTYYHAWVEGGRTTMSRSWGEFIKNTYAPIRIK